MIKLVRFFLCGLLFGPILFVFWQICGAELWALPSMDPVQGILQRVTVESSRKSSWVEVSYRYEYSGQTFGGDQLTCCTSLTRNQFGNAGETRDQLKPLEGKPVTVWVDPRQPSRSVLFRSPPYAALAVMVFCLVLVLRVVISIDQATKARRPA